MSYQKLRFALPALLLAGFLVSCSSCAATPRTRSADEQHNAAVKIETTCHDSVHWGSGVVVSRDRVLTAKHVIQCQIVPGLPFFTEPQKVTVDPGDGIKRDVSVELSFEGNTRDIARLQTTDSSLAEFLTPIKIGALPSLGDRVCEASAVPRWTYRCGYVQPDDGYIRMEMLTEYGNSGSGLYNTRGELIGIVVQLWLCQDGFLCGGRAAKLQDWPWLVP